MAGLSRVVRQGMNDMTHEHEWNFPPGRKAPLLGKAGTGILRIMLLFGSAAIAFGLILAPVAIRHIRSQPGFSGIDHMSTGSIGDRGSHEFRRSAPQNASGTCIIRPDGRHSGDC